MLASFILRAVIDVVRAGKQPDRGSVLFDLPPLIVEVKHLDIASVIGHARLAVDQMHICILPCLNHRDRHRPPAHGGRIRHLLQVKLHRREIAFLICLFFILELTGGEAAEQNRGFAFCFRQLLAETFFRIVNADTLLDRQDDAVHFALLEAAPALTLVLDLLLDFRQRQLAFQRIPETGTVAHCDQRLIDAEGLGFADALAAQRIDTVDLVCEIEHFIADAVIGKGIIQRIDSGALLQRFELLVIAIPVRRIHPAVFIIKIIQLRCGAAYGIRIITHICRKCTHPRFAVADILDHGAVCCVRKRIIPDLGFPDARTVNIHLGLDAVGFCVMEIRHHRPSGGSGVVDHIIEIVFRLAVGRTDIFLIFLQNL